MIEAVNDVRGIDPARGLRLDLHALHFKIVSGTSRAAPHLQCLGCADARAQPAAQEPELAEESKLLFFREHTLVDAGPEATPLGKYVLDELYASNAGAGHQRFDKFNRDGVQRGMTLRFKAQAARSRVQLCAL